MAANTATPRLWSDYRAHRTVGYIPGCETLASNQNPQKYKGQRVVIGSVTDGYLPRRLSFRTPESFLNSSGAARRKFSSAPVRLGNPWHRSSERTGKGHGLGRSIRWTRISKRYGQCRQHQATAGCHEADLWCGHSHRLLYCPVFSGYHGFWGYLPSGQKSMRPDMVRKSKLRGGFKKTSLTIYVKTSWLGSAVTIYNKRDRSYFRGLEIKRNGWRKKTAVLRGQRAALRTSRAWAPGHCGLLLPWGSAWLGKHRATQPQNNLWINGFWHGAVLQCRTF